MAINCITDKSSQSYRLISSSTCQTHCSITTTSSFMKTNTEINDSSASQVCGRECERWLRCTSICSKRSNRPSLSGVLQHPCGERGRERADDQERGCERANNRERGRERRISTNRSSHANRAPRSSFFTFSAFSRRTDETFRKESCFLNLQRTHREIPIRSFLPFLFPLLYFSFFALRTARDHCEMFRIIACKRISLLICKKH